MRESEGEQSRSERWKIKGLGAFYPRVEEVWITSSPKVFRIDHTGFFILISSCAKLTYPLALHLTEHHNSLRLISLSTIKVKLSPVRPLVALLVIAVPDAHI